MFKPPALDYFYNAAGRWPVCDHDGPDWMDLALAGALAEEMAEEEKERERIKKEMEEEQEKDDEDCEDHLK